MAKPAASLLGIPGQLRNQIYEHIFIPAEDARPASSVSKRLQPLLTCRQIHEEARILAFSQAAFVISVPHINKDGKENTVKDKLSVLALEQVKAVRSVHIDFAGYINADDNRYDLCRRFQA